MLLLSHQSHVCIPVHPGPIIFEMTSTTVTMGSRTGIQKAKCTVERPTLAPPSLPRSSDLGQQHTQSATPTRRRPSPDFFDRFHQQNKQNRIIKSKKWLNFSGLVDGDRRRYLVRVAWVIERYCTIVCLFCASGPLGPLAGRTAGCYLARS